MQKKRHDKLNIAEAALKLGMSTERLSSELQIDAKRPAGEKHYPFADPIQGDTGRWTYNIYTEKLNEYLTPKSEIDLERLADMVAGRVVKLLSERNTA